MKKNLIVLLILLTSTIANAQFIKEKSINAQIGYGFTFPYDSTEDFGDDGFFAQSELVLKITNWVDFRPYAGFIITNSNGKDLDGNPTNQIAESQAFLLGAKSRIRIPIPYVAPYAEVGIGTSIGKFRTLTRFYNFDKTGIIYHIPFSLGLELGRKHNVDISFTYFYQPSVKQYVGAFAAGLTFPLN
ncbi:hypothetical protein [Olleya namhaensis]|uniref:hypothetical protein n=1 Tax=Olleya namhaensis TaxID=1144750 RepID=UPI002490CA75|nr:hypothetical protein [Olleya namhaensis]